MKNGYEGYNRRVSERTTKLHDMLWIRCYLKVQNLGYSVEIWVWLKLFEKFFCQPEQVIADITK